MNNKLNEIILRRKDAILVEQTDIDPTIKDYKQALVATAAKNLESLGYTLSPELANEMLNTSIEDIVKTARFLTEEIKHKLGGDVEYHPLYPGFPESVLERSDVTLFFDALVYAISGFEVLPFDTIHEKEAKAEGEKISKLKQIGLADIESIKEIASNLMASQVAFSQDDKNDLLTIYDNYKDSFSDFIPKKVPNKENLTWLAAEYMKKESPYENPFLEKMNSATDVLRLVVARCGGDTSLTEKPIFKSLPRSETATYAKKIAYMKNTESDIYRRSEIFKRLSERYHFRRIKDDKVQELLDKIYKNDLDRSFLGKRDALIEEGNYSKLVALYKRNPGQMGADIAMLARMATKAKNYSVAKAALCSKFRKNSGKMSTLNLIKVEAMLRGSMGHKDVAIFAPKKGLANPWMQIEKRQELPEDIALPLVNIARHTLKERYAEKRPLGKVYIEEGLKDIKIPSQQRANSKGSTGMTYGSKFNIKEDVKCLRSFIWWTNSQKSDYVDIDLSAAIYDEKFNKLADISYWDLKGGGFGVHSGDIRNGGPIGGKGAAEFIDINFDNLAKRTQKMNAINNQDRKAAYVLFTVRVYSGENFMDTPCKFGWMESDHTPARLFDITKVEKAIELNTESTRSIPVLFDIEERKMIWLDRNPREISNFRLRDDEDMDAINNNITYASSDIVEMRKALTNSIPDLYTLMALHVEARGELVSNPKEADTLFTVERVAREDFPDAKEFLCAYDTADILGDLVTDEPSVKDIEYFKALEEAQREAERIAVHEADIEL